MAAAILWTGLTVIDLASAEAGRGGSRGGGFGGGFRSGSHGGIGHGFRGGVSHGFRGGVGHGFHGGLHGGIGHTFDHGLHHHGHNHFFFSVGVGAFYPFYSYPYYPVAYPYPVYYPAYTPVYQYQQYSPCGYYDPNGVWVDAPCPQYTPPVSTPQPENSSQGVSAAPAQQSSEGAVGPPSPY
ncbi:MAG: hypothetical protein C3F12_07600 [Candidatus Methylomirabilota bacterium]|nr:MAG: hypothetical protein C3F12_07600 [candidate division NC10 bacterium]